MSYVALLRAVNVGGTKLPMADLRALLEGLGLTNVRTYLQSGNAVFDAGDGTEPAAASPRPSRCASSATSGRAWACSSCRARRWPTSSPPTPSSPREGAGEDEKILHATLLFGAHGEADFGEASDAAYCAVYKAAFKKLELPAADGEEAAFVGAPPLATPVVYLKLPHGYGRTKLNNAWFERKLGTAATTRNWRTVLALTDMVTATRG